VTARANLLASSLAEVNMRFIVTGALSVLLGACATDATDRPEVAVKRVCETETPTGSKLPVKRCWTTEEVAQNEQDVRDASKIYERSRPPGIPTR
jgi:hypothetical protein